jgi:serine/arginine repetitive matrix protein 2
MSRYYPRDRERERTPPTRFYNGRGDRNDFNRPDVPRGPRQNSDTPTRAPTGPRGGRGNYRDSRDSREPIGFPERGDRWREGEFSQRPRSRTPPRRDSREFPKPIDTNVSRRDGARDGPLSAGSGSNISDAPRNASYRGGFTRGRGDFRGRSYQGEDRSSFRPRSRSRGPRRERDRSVDSRDLDYRDRQRDTDERRFYRERDERDGSYFRRDQPPKTESRQAPFGGPASAQSTPQSERPPPLQDRSVGDPRRESDLSRRGSTISDTLVPKDGRRDGERYDLITGRPDPARPARAASPPPSAPQVPAFGSFRPSFQTTSSSISWVNPNLQKPSSAAPQPFKGPPTAPRALATSPSALSSHPPTAPKADRVFEQTRASQNVPDGALEVSPAAKRPVSPSQPSSKSAGELQQVLSTPTGPAREMATTSGVKHLAPPSAPRAMTSPSNFNRAPSPNPPGNNPVWGRPNAPHTSPRMLTGNIPTGPKADRMAPQSLRTQPPPRPYRASSQPFAERPSTVPSKRESNGQERERGHGSDRRSTEPQSLTEGLGVIESKLYGTNTLKGPGEDVGHTSNTAHRSDVLLKDHDSHAVKTIEDVEMAETSLGPKLGGKQTAVERTAQDIMNDRSDDDYDEELDDDYLAQHEKGFLNDKARLEAKKVDLSAEEFCPSMLLETAARLAAIRLVVSDLEFRQTNVPGKRGVKEELMIGSTPTELAFTAEEDDYDQDMDVDEDDSSRESSLDRMSTPDLESLPYLEKGPPTPLSDPDPFSTLRYESVAEQEIKAKLKIAYDDNGDEQEALLRRYRELYVPWKQYIMDIDRAKEDADTAMKQSSPEIIVTPVTAETVLPATTPTESSTRRMHRNASQYEIDKIMELSLREEEEKRQREQEAKEAQASASADREARIPDMLPRREIERRRFEDVSQARQPRDAIRLFEFVPPLDDFTEEEDRILRTEYAQNIKVWGKIAAKLKPRSYKECINHYYATKWDKPYKTSYKGGRKARGTRGRGRGGTRGGRSALVPADADMDIGDGNGSTTPLVTDTGRPRRAAAPVWPKDAEGEQGLALATPGRKPGATRMDGTRDGEAGDKPSRRGGKGGKEKGSRKPRNQPIAARPVISPQKAEKELLKDKNVPMQADDWLARAQSAARESDFAMQQIYADNGLPGYKADIQQSGVSAPTERPRSHSQTQRQGASSYWSVVEEHDFRKCLAYFGTDYQAIANHMGTKTQTMVSLASP